MKFASSGNLIKLIPNIKVILALTIIICNVNIAKTDNDKNTISESSDLNSTLKITNITNFIDNTLPNYTNPQKVEIMPVI